MTRPACVRSALFRALVIATFAGGVVPQAQQPPTSAVSSPAGPASAPPVIRFAAGGISLEDAVRVTLENDPAVQRAEAGAAFQKGVWQEQSGLFDLSLLGSASYSRRIQELTESAKADQRKKRQVLEDIIAAGPDRIKLAQQARDLFGRIQNGTATSQELTSTSPTLAASLLQLDALIATAPPALASQLRATRQQLLTDAIASADQDLADQRQILADTQRQRTNLGDPAIDEDFTDVTLNLAFSKLFRNGIAVSPFVDGAFNQTGFRGKPHEAEFGGKGLTDLYTFHAGVNTVVPLSRGRGRDAVAAPERAAAIEHDASLLILEHRRPESVLNTVLAYWALRAAQETAVIATQSRQFQQQLVTLAGGRVTSGDLAAFELTRAQAADARAQADLEDALRALKDARVGLATAMGVVSTDDDATLPLASDAFPLTAQSPSTPLVEQALQQRQDLSAAVKRQEAGQVLANGARLNLRSLIDVNVSTFFTALDEGNARQALDRWVGPSAIVGVQLEKPLGNNVFRGQLAQQESSARLRQIDQRDLARQIQLNVIQSTSTLQESIRRVQQAQTAVGLYQTTIDAELARLRTGDATVIDTITTQQQQVGALVSLVGARLELAERIIRLRFDTGTLVTAGVVRPQDLVTVPGGTR